MTRHPRLPDSAGSWLVVNAAALRCILLIAPTLLISKHSVNNNNLTTVRTTRNSSTQPSLLFAQYEGLPGFLTSPAPAGSERPLCRGCRDRPGQFAHRLG